MKAHTYNYDDMLYSVIELVNETGKSIPTALTEILQANAMYMHNADRELIIWDASHSGLIDNNKFNK